MNKITLDELFNRYEENIDMLYDAEHDEIFKWRALKTFQKEWFSLEYTDFLSRFNAATKDFLSRRPPRGGVFHHGAYRYCVTKNAYRVR